MQFSDNELHFCPDIRVNIMGYCRQYPNILEINENGLQFNTIQYTFCSSLLRNTNERKVLFGFLYSMNTT